ncbi:unnamed protein product [Calicophoron daubneyi]|uniref:Uncharacterized protein n=1 Tax=Calicophoron daubneyi TaxID=300641 RepID=A0AAV2TJ51_CALDB
MNWKMNPLNPLLFIAILSVCALFQWTPIVGKAIGESTISEQELADALDRTEVVYTGPVHQANAMVQSHQSNQSPVSFGRRIYCIRICVRGRCIVRCVVR